MTAARKILPLTLFLLTISAAFPQTPPDNLTVKIAVMGPGSELYFWWGHMALIIEDSARGDARCYDYGLFSWESENFFLNFAFGRLLYQTGVSKAENVYKGYIAQNRDVALYTLNLPPEKKRRIKEFAEWNVLPENRNYWYHHFRDNCVTRIINILDEATDGQFYGKYGSEAGRFTLRGHVRRHTYWSPFWDWLLNFLMGQVIDTPITKQDEMFLPSEVARNISDFSYTDDAGNTRKLVSNVEIVNASKGRPPVLEAPPPRLTWQIPAGLIIAAYFVIAIFIRKKREKLGRILWGAGKAAAGLFFGIAGSLLFFMTFFTNHDYTFQNANIIFVNPLLLAALPLGIITACAEKNPKRGVFCEALLSGLHTYIFLGGVLTVLIKLSPAYYQENAPTLALILPFALVGSWASAPFRKAHYGTK